MRKIHSTHGPPSFATEIKATAPLMKQITDIGNDARPGLGHGADATRTRC